MKTIILLCLFVLGVFLAKVFKSKINIAKNKIFIKTARKQNERAMKVRDHTMRLNEVTFLLSKLREYDNETEIINTFIHRIGISIDKLNAAIESGNEAWAGSLLTSFSRHLREVLNESALSKIEFSTCTMHVEHLLSLLTSINKNSWGFEIRDHGIIEFDNPRFIRSLAIMPWIADILWEAVVSEKPINYVGIEISSDTYNATYKVMFEGNEMKRSVPFLDGEIDTLEELN
jgi:hypothetical protein